MNKLKYLIQLSVVLLLTLALAACGSNGNESESSGSEMTTHSETSTSETTSDSETVDSETTSSETTSDSETVDSETVDSETSTSETTESETTNPGEIIPESFTVTFKDYSGVMLGTVEVNSGESAAAPVIPAREGYTFIGWSDSLDQIKSDKTVIAQYTLNAGNNILDISYMLGANNTVTLTYAMKSNVLFCGMEGYVNVPQGFTFESLTQGNGATANYKDGKVYFMFASNSGQNVTSETVLFTLTFVYADSVSAAEFETVVSDIYDQNYQNVSYSVIGEQVAIQYGSHAVTGNNILNISHVLGANNTVTLTYTMTGNVLFCGMEGYVNVPQGFTFESLTQGNGATANYKDGKVYFMFASNSGQNVTSETVLFTLTFVYADSVSAAEFETVVSDIYDQNYQNVEFTVVGEQVKIK